MMSPLKIGFIGSGKMASAIASGIIRQDKTPKVKTASLLAKKIACFSLVFHIRLSLVYFELNFRE